MDVYLCRNFMSASEMRMYAATPFGCVCLDLRKVHCQTSTCTKLRSDYPTVRVMPADRRIRANSQPSSDTARWLTLCVCVCVAKRRVTEQHNPPCWYLQSAPSEHIFFPDGRCFCIAPLVGPATRVRVMGACSPSSSTSKTVRMHQ